MRVPLETADIIINMAVAERMKGWVDISSLVQQISTLPTPEAKIFKRRYLKKLPIIVNLN